MASFNFKVLLGLDSSRFSKSIRKAEVEFARFTSTLTSMAGALGAGLGLGALLGKLKDTATDLSVANATLRNTFMNNTENMMNYGDAIEFLNRLSKDYKQEIISLTQSFANFHAAADQMNISFDAQKQVYEAMTKASTYFHLSSERTHDALVAVEQMMSKGKVTAEELRRQLGNNLPGAFGLMAKAVGMTTAELEKAMKAGQVIADEKTMTAFAEELNKLTQNIDLNSLQLAMNEVANAWARLTQSTGFEQSFTKMLESVSKGLNYIRVHLNTIKGSIKSVIGAIVAGKVIKTLGAVVVKTNAWKDAFKAIHHAEKVLADPLKHTQREIAVATKMTNGWSRAQATLQGLVIGLFESFKAFMASNIFTLALLAISEITNQVIQFAKATRDAKNTYKNLSREISKDLDEKVSGSRNSKGVLDLSSDLANLKELKRGTKEYGETVKDIYAKMDMKSPIDAMSTSWDTVNGKVQEYIDHLDDVAMMEVYTSQIANLKAEQMQMQRDMENYEPGFWRKMWANFTAAAVNQSTIGTFDSVKEGKDYYTVPKHMIEKYNQTEKLINDLVRIRHTYYQKLSKWNSDHPTNTGGGGGGGDSSEKEKEPYYKVLKKYKEEKTKLDNQLKNGAINAEEYTKSMNDVVRTAGKGIMAFDDYFNEAKKYGKEAESLTQEIADSFKNVQITDNVSKIVNDTMDDFLDELEKELDKEMDKFQKKMELDVDVDLKVATGDVPKIDLEKDRSLFDYKNTGKKLFEDDYKIASKYVEDLKKEIDSLKAKKEELGELGESASRYLDELVAKFELASASADSFKSAMDYAEIANDIKKYQQELLALGAGGIKDLANSMDRIVKGAESMKSVFEDDDSTGWDKFMAVFNEIVQVVDGIVSVYQTIQKISEKNAMLEGAKLALQTAQNKKATEQLGLEIATAKALKQQAAAKASINAMEVPFPGNIGALAANMAAIESAFAVAGAFKDGGIIDYGSSTGDKTLARVNRGEMVINKAQQATLFNAISSGKLGGGNVEFKIRGEQLVGVIDNYKSRIRG